MTITVDEAEWREGKIRNGDDWDLGVNNEAFVVATFAVRDAVQAYAPSANIDGRVIK